MTTKTCLAIAALLWSGLSFTLGQPVGFTYQGKLDVGGTPVTGSYEFTFGVYDNVDGGNAVSSVMTNSATMVNDGIFTVALDFGTGVFTGAPRWLEIGVRTNGDVADFILLAPRQQITPSPYALYAPNAGAAVIAGSATAVTGPVAATQLSGTIASSNIAPGTITGAMLAPGSITSEALADGAVSLGKLELTNISQILTIITNPTPAADDRFGSAIAVVGGNRIVVGAFNDDTSGTNVGIAYFFNLDGALLAAFTDPLPVANDWFGRAVAAVGSDKVLISCEGADFGASAAGAAYLFDLNGNVLATYTNPTPAVADYFGYAVAAVGSDRVLIGAYSDNTGASDAGAAYLFDVHGTLITTFNNPSPANSDYFGRAVAGVGGDKVLIGAPQDCLSGFWSGAAYLFSTNGTLLVTITNPAPENYDLFGSPVVWAGGGKVLIGAVGDNYDAAYLFDLNGQLLSTFTNPHSPSGVSDFGTSVAAAGPDKVLIGVPGDSSVSTHSGMACLFSSGGRPLTVLTNPTPWPEDHFGFSVAAADAKTLLIGAYNDTVDGARVGAVYVYSSSTSLPGLAGDGAVAGSIHADMLAAGSVTTTALANGAVGSAQLANGAVTAANIASNTITAGQLANGAVGQAQLAGGAAAANLYASGQSGVASGGIVLSEQENNTDLLNAGYVKIGKVDLVEEGWASQPSGPPASGLPNLSRSHHSAVWTGTEMIVWSGSTTPYQDISCFQDGGRYNPTLNSWSLVSTVGAPPGQWDPLAVWTGSKMIIWGVRGNGIYNPVADTWQSMSPWSETNKHVRGSQQAVWCGNTLVLVSYAHGYDSLFGDEYDFLTFDGARYNPANDTWSPMNPTNAPSGRGYYSAVWDGTELLVWGGVRTRWDGGNPNYQCYNSGARYNPSIDAWTIMNTNGAPSPRIRAHALWTGSEMIIWSGAIVWSGGNISGAVEWSGGRYNPATDTWAGVSTNGAPAVRVGETAVWTGSRMVIWGGHSNYQYTASGGRYNPSTDIWLPTRLVANPSPRAFHSAVWTGSQMIVWGGENGSDYFDQGGRYDATGDSWQSMAASPPTGEIGPRVGATAVWTGNEMIVWGGESDGCYLRNGARYSPAQHAWTVMPLQDAPSARVFHTAVWTGTEMIIWGGNDGSVNDTGARYNPTLDSWQSMTNLDAPDARTGHAAVWTGNEMIIWGGGASGDDPWPTTGGRYNPTTDTWTPTPTNNAPSGRLFPTAVWTGQEMLLWGGVVLSPGLYPIPVGQNTGGAFDPATGTWTTLGTSGAPAARWGHTAVWTGRQMIVWGGQNTYSNLNTGACYTPGQVNPWSATTLSSAPTPRTDHTAVWDGTRMLVWGGEGSAYYATGARYDPIQDQWLGTTLTGAPTPRARHTAVWTGTEMIIADGEDSGANCLNSVHSYTPPRRTFLYLKP